MFTKKYLYLLIKTKCKGMKTILNVYDFDDTLVKSPQPTSALAIDKIHSLQRNRYMMEPSLEAIEKDFVKWWDSEISLDANYFNFATNLPVWKHYMDAKKNPNALNILISHRKPNLSNKIKEILINLGYDLDAHYFGGRTDRTKADILLDVLDNYPNVSHVEFHEDEILHLQEYEKTLQEHYKHYTYKLFLVNAKSTIQLKSVACFLNGFDAKDNLLKF